jgi:hypothetical protein
MPALKISTAKTGGMPSILKKTTVKNSKTTTESSIKYKDKSAGQPELIPIFEKIKALLKVYAKDNLKEQEGTAGMYNLISTRPVELLGKTRELFFASVMVQKGFVGFYFFPIYTDPAISSELPIELLKCLKGKSCFHIKKNDDQLMGQIEQALETGYKLYQEKGYL